MGAAIRGNPSLWNALQTKKTLGQESLSEEDCHVFSDAEEIILHYDGYEVMKAETILIGLGIPAQQVHRPLKELSGGYKMRVL